MGLTKKAKAEWQLGNEWNLIQFDLVNPTGSAVVLDLFNPNTFNQVANTPYGLAPIDPITGNPAPIPTPDIAPNTYQAVTSAPFTSSAVIYDTVNNKVWAGQAVGSNLYTYNDTPPSIFPTYNIIPTVQSNISALSFSPASNKVIAVCNLNGFITILNATTETVIVDLSLAFAGFNWVEYNSIKDSWYASTIGADFILEISAVTNSVVATIPLPLGTVPQRMAFNVNTNQMLTAGNGNNTIVKMDCATNTFITYASPVVAPFALGINPVDNFGYVGSDVTAGVWIFNPTTNLPIVNVLPLARATDFQYYAGTDKIYILDPVANVVYVLDAFGVLFATVPFAGTSSTLTLNTSENIVYFSSSSAPILNSIISNALVFYISGSSDYNKFVLDIQNSPAWTRRIVFYTGNRTLQQVVNGTYKNAEGVLINFPLIPRISVGEYQVQIGISMLDFPNNELVLGINQWFSSFIVPAFTSTTMVLAYKQIDKSALLVNKSSLESTMDMNHANQPQTISKKAINESQAGDYDFFVPLNTKIYSKLKHLRGNLISPFDFGEFNKVFNNKKLKK